MNRGRQSALGYREMCFVCLITVFVLCVFLHSSLNSNILSTTNMRPCFLLYLRFILYTLPVVRFDNFILQSQYTYYIKSRFFCAAFVSFFSLSILTYNIIMRCLRLIQRVYLFHWISPAHYINVMFQQLILIISYSILHSSMHIFFSVIIISRIVVPFRNWCSHHWFPMCRIVQASVLFATFMKTLKDIFCAGPHQGFKWPWEQGPLFGWF